MNAKRTEHTPKRVYISGPMTGIPDHNRTEFSRASLAVAMSGNIPVNPHQLDHSGHDQSWEEFMRVDLAALATCQACYMLRGWRYSRGAKWEHREAKRQGLLVVYQSGFFGGWMKAGAK